MTISISAARTTALAGITDNPFVAWSNLAAAATLGGTATLSGGPAANAVTGTTYDYWLPNVSATTAQFRVTFAAPRTISFAAIAAHNLGTLGATVALQRSTDGGATWSSAGASAITPADDSAIAFRTITSGNDAADWRFFFSGLTAGAPLYAGVCFFGDDTVIPRRIYQGFSPVLTPTEVSMQSNVSIGGNYLGSSVITKGSTISAAFTKVDPTFVRGAFLPFATAFNGGSPCFFGWRPATYPQDIHYGWRNGAVIRPVNSDARDLMDFTLAMQVFEP